MNPLEMILLGTQSLSCSEPVKKDVSEIMFKDLVLILVSARDHDVSDGLVEGRNGATT